MSPYLFNVYVDNLSSMLNKCNVGCYFGGLLVNHIMYADDLVLLSPSVAGLSKLQKICERFGDGHYVQYNPKKSAVITFRASYLKGVKLKPMFKLNDVHLKEVDSIKYLGHIVRNDLTDDLDIERQCRQLYAQGNMILRRFYMCDPAVKMTLFRSYCSPLYTAQLWWSHKKSTMNKLYVTHHNIFKLFLGLSKYESTSTLCTETGVQCC